jgi:hypothetical protein
VIFLILLCTACSSSALADESTDQKISQSALAETREIMASELFGHYDITTLRVLKVEDLRGRLSSERDYGVMSVTLAFSATRNATRSASLNPDVFEPGKCWGWLYLHCGVPPGHVFEGKLEVLLTVDRDGSWRVVSPHWRSRRRYSLDGYLLLEGREKEGYVVFPKQGKP